MRVIMLRDAVGSENGYTVKDFANGETYEMEDSLAQAFVMMKYAKQLADDVETDEVPVAPATSKKSKKVDEAENKALTSGDYENKSAKTKG